MSKRSENYRKNGKKYEWIGHIQVHFNDVEREEVLSYVGQREWDFEECICVLTQKGYGTKFTYDQSRDCYYLTLQTKEKGNHYYGYTLGMTHTELTRIVQIACYVVDVLVEHESLSYPEKDRADNW